MPVILWLLKGFFFFFWIKELKYLVYWLNLLKTRGSFHQNCSSSYFSCRLIWLEGWFPVSLPGPSGGCFFDFNLIQGKREEIPVCFSRLWQLLSQKIKPHKKTYEIEDGWYSWKHCSRQILLRLTNTLPENWVKF